MFIAVFPRSIAHHWHYQPGSQLSPDYQAVVKP